MYLKEDTEIYQYVKFMEDFFNTVYLEDTCNIGILEKIDRIKRAYDLNKLDDKYLMYYNDKFGSELNISLNDIQELIDVNNLSDKILYRYVRNLYQNIPFINQYKGSNAAIIIILKCFGCLPVLIQKWISRIEGDSSMIEMEQTDLSYEKQTSYFDPRYYYQYDQLKDYYLSSHFSIDLGYDDKSIKEVEKNAKTLVKVISNVKPISRVLDDLWYTIKTYFDGYLNYNNNNIYDNNIGFETIQYYWSTIEDKSWLNVYTKGAFVESIDNGKLVTLTFGTYNTLKWTGKGTQRSQGPYYNKESNSYDFWYNIFHNLELHNDYQFCLNWDNGTNKYIFTKDNYKIKILDDTIELYLYGLTAQSIPENTRFSIWFYKAGEEIQTFNYSF